MSDDRAARREAAVLVALITIAVVIAPFSPDGVIAGLLGGRPLR